MKVEQQPAYLLHARPYSETSLLVDFFTQGHGRLMLLAKGARRGKARSRGVLLPFKPLLVSWAGKGQLPILTSAEQSGHTEELQGQTLASGFYLNELVLRLLHRHDSHETLFKHYDHALKQLAKGGAQTQVAQNQATRPILRIFEKKLLHDIGFGAVLDRNAETGEVISDQQRYQYVLEKGPVSLGNANERTLTIHGSTLCALHAETFQSDAQLREAQRLTRVLIDHQLNGRRLRCRRVLLEMNQYINSGAQTANAKPGKAFVGGK